jgi:hypothetical protein
LRIKNGSGIWNIVEVELAILGFHIAVGCIFWCTILMPKMGVAGCGSASLVTHSNLRGILRMLGLYRING